MVPCIRSGDAETPPQPILQDYPGCHLFAFESVAFSLIGQRTTRHLHEESRVARLATQLELCAEFVEVFADQRQTSKIAL